jgi:hypothetical protein
MKMRHLAYALTWGFLVMAAVSFSALMWRPTWLYFFAFLASVLATCVMALTADTWAERDFQNFAECEERLDAAEKKATEHGVSVYELTRKVVNAEKAADACWNQLKSVQHVWESAAGGIGERLKKLEEDSRTATELAIGADRIAKEALETSSKATLTTGYRR